MKIEAKKKLKSSSASVATIADVQPGKVKVHFDGCGSDQDFWCSNFSTEIHPPMWCSKVMKVKAESPKGKRKKGVILILNVILPYYNNLVGP